MSTPLQIDPTCIVKQGYLTKSPPTNEITLIRKRWHLRWFILYDTHAGSHPDPNAERDVFMLYYKNDIKVMNGSPKGKISLVGADIYRHRGKIHGFTHVINIQTSNRLYHICASQIFVYNDWLNKLRAHYVPYSITPDVGRCHCSSISSSPGGCSTHSERSFSVSSNCSNSSGTSMASSSAFSDGDETETCINVRCNTSAPRDMVVRNTTLPRMPTNKHTRTFHSALHASKSCSAESDDEGLGRTDSESSVTSLEMLASLMNIDISNFDRGSTLGNFVGPKIYARPNTSSLTLQRTRSVEDILHPVNEIVTQPDV